MKTLVVVHRPVSLEVLAWEAGTGAVYGAAAPTLQVPSSASTAWRYGRERLVVKAALRPELLDACEPGVALWLSGGKEERLNSQGAPQPMAIVTKSAPTVMRPVLL